MLQIKNLSFRTSAGKELLDSVSFEVDQGEFVGLVGPSGAGKTTLLRCISGLYKPAQGRLILDGRDFSSTPVVDRSISYMQQSFPLYEHLTVLENVLVASGGSRAPQGTVRDAKQLLEDIGIADAFFNRAPANLSGGETQRVALCKALMRPAAVLLLDEPFSNLDKRRRRELGARVHAIARQRQARVLFVSHDESDVVFLSDRICVMNKGKILQYGDLGELRRHPKHEQVASFALETGLQVAGLHVLGTAEAEKLRLRFNGHNSKIAMVGWRPDLSTMAGGDERPAHGDRWLTFGARVARIVPATGGAFVQLTVLRGAEHDPTTSVWHFHSAVEGDPPPNGSAVSLRIPVDALIPVSADGKITMSRPRSSSSSARQMHCGCLIPVSVAVAVAAG